MMNRSSKSAMVGSLHQFPRWYTQDIRLAYDFPHSR